MPRLLSTLLLPIMLLGRAKNDAPEPKEKSFVVHPIGHVQKTKGRTRIVLEKNYQEGLLGLKEWSHVQVIW